MLVEGAVRSGALNTARWTSELQRPLLAVPGPVSSVTSDGLHQLIRNGDASLVTRAADVLEDLAAHMARAGVDASVSQECITPTRADHRPEHANAPSEPPQRASPSR